MDDKKWETKSEYVNGIIDLLIDSMNDLDVAEIMFEKNVQTLFSYSNKLLMTKK